MSHKQSEHCHWRNCLVGGLLLLLAMDPAIASQCKVNNSNSWKDKFVEITGDFTGDGNEDLFLVGNPKSWLCTGPNLYCNQQNINNWSQFDVVSGDYNGDGYDDLFLVGTPDSWVCLGPGLSCSVNNSYNWKTLFKATSGDYTGDGFDDLFLTGDPLSWLCTGPNLYCNIHNTYSWKSQFNAVSGNYDGDGHDDLFLVGTPDSWVCPGPGLNCSVNNSYNWKTLFEASSAHLNADGKEDLYLIGDPISWVCYGPALYCNVDNENKWKTKYDVVLGDFDGDGLSNAFLTGNPVSHVCEMPSVPCQESALQPVVCEDDVSSLVPITVTTAMNTSKSIATFQSHNQRVVQNSGGIFVAANAGSGHWQLQRSTDGGTTFTTARDVFVNTNPPALETDSAGNVYAFYAQNSGQSNAIYEKYEASTGYTTPAFSTVIPVPSVSKFTTFFDQVRQQIYFMNFNAGGGNFYTVSPIDGSVCADAFCPQQLSTPGPEATLQYPHLRMLGSTLYAAWTTTPFDFQSNGLVWYRGIHAMASEDGGRAWLNIDHTPVATPVVEDDTGPTLQIVEACDLDASTWLSSFAAAGGDLHFLYLSQRGNGLEHYVRIDTATGVEEQRTAPLNGTKVSIRNLDGFMVVDGSVIYAVSRGCRRIVVLVSQDNGATWQDYAASDEIPAGYGSYGISGFREVTSDGFIVGAYTEYDTTPQSTDHRVKFFKVPAL